MATIDQYSIINSSMVDNRCILFLGPKFAMSKDGKKVHASLRDTLAEPYKLDSNFDNLCIIEEPQPDAELISSLKIQLNSLYDEMVAHDIYQKICSLRFKAVVSCTHDPFLPAAFSEVWKRPPNFKYFSRKVQQDSHTETINSQQAEQPLLYNVFGLVRDKESLITTYDTFYDFLMKLIGDNPKTPQELQYSLSKSSVLILIGFDLGKWYMPLLFRKLRNYVGVRERSDEIVAYVSTDDTEDMDQTRLRYLQHYAIKVKSLDNDSIGFIDRLYNTDKVRLKLPKASFSIRGLSEATKEEKEIICEKLSEVIELLIDGEYGEALDLLTSAFKSIEEEYNRVLNFHGLFNDIKNKYQVTMDINKRDYELRELRNMVTTYCNDKKRELDCQ